MDSLNTYWEEFNMKHLKEQITFREFKNIYYKLNIEIEVEGNNKVIINNIIKQLKQTNTAAVIFIIDKEMRRRTCLQQLNDGSQKFNKEINTHNKVIQRLSEIRSLRQSREWQINQHKLYGKKYHLAFQKQKQIENDLAMQKQKQLEKRLETDYPLYQKTICDLKNQVSVIISKRKLTKLTTANEQLKELLKLLNTIKSIYDQAVLYPEFKSIIMDCRKEIESKLWRLTMYFRPKHHPIVR